jgi:hypothetical protein
LRLTTARRGAILASLVILLALMLGSQQPIAQQYPRYTYLYTPKLGEVRMTHEYIFVKAQDLTRYAFRVGTDDCALYGCEVVINFYVYDFLGMPSDIIFRALTSEGWERYPRSKVEQLSWSFKAAVGTYILEFDNTYSLKHKSVDLVVAVRVLPTITEYRVVATEYITEYRTKYIETPTVTSILSRESIQILVLVAAVAFIAGILLTLLVRRS